MNKIVKKVGMAVVGCGMMAQGMHLPNILKHPDIELVWCCDINEKLLEDVNQKFKPLKSTTEPVVIAQDRECDAVLLCTTHKVRLPLIEMFANAGKHIYVEKPLSDSFEEMKKIIKIVKRTGIKFTVGHNRRAAPAVKEALRVLNKHQKSPISPSWRWNREGEERPDLVGEDQTMVLLRINDDFWSWKKWAFETGALINEMTHFADLACCFIDSKPTRVTTSGNKQANHVVTIEFENGSLATIFATAFGSFGYPKELVEIYHNGAVIALDHLLEMRVAGVEDEAFQTYFPFMEDRHPYISDKGINGYYKHVLANHEEVISSGVKSLLPEGPDKGHFSLLDDFVKCIMFGGEPICSAEIAAVPTAIILKAIESEKLGGIPVKISEDDYSVSLHPVFLQMYRSNR
jgi:Predicted dehydrogenases and related proteins